MKQPVAFSLDDPEHLGSEGGRRAQRPDLAVQLPKRNLDRIFGILAARARSPREPAQVRLTDREQLLNGGGIAAARCLDQLRFGDHLFISPNRPTAYHSAHVGQKPMKPVPANMTPAPMPTQAIMELSA
jgi:hypothetical protein